MQVFETGGMVATFVGQNEDDHNGHELSTLAKLDVDKVGPAAADTCRGLRHR